MTSCRQAEGGGFMFVYRPGGVTSWLSHLHDDVQMEDRTVWYSPPNVISFWLFSRHVIWSENESEIDASFSY